jgi:hypothetical protein
MSDTTAATTTTTATATTPEPILVSDQAPTLGDEHDDVNEERTTETTMEEPKKSSNIEPLEIEPNQSMDNDMESLLPGGAPTRPPPSGGDGKDHPKYCRGMIQPQPVGNMQILFPELFHSQDNAWGVVGPQPIGPFFVWLIICVATHFVVKRALQVGILSTIICYAFFAYSTFLLVDVSFRDPGICFDKTIPEDVPADEARLWRWCDFCNGFQPPDGAHCPQCNVCVAGYDHHCDGNVHWQKELSTLCEIQHVVVVVFVLCVCMAFGDCHVSHHRSIATTTTTSSTYCYCVSIMLVSVRLA